MISPFFGVQSKTSLSRQHLEQGAVRIEEVEAAAAMAMINLHVVRRPRPAAIGEALAADAIEDPVELRFGDLEGVMVPLEAVPIIKVDRQGVVDPHRSEV